jgi:uncharacterized protein (DUF433 family)
LLHLRVRSVRTSKNLTSTADWQSQSSLARNLSKTPVLYKKMFPLQDRIIHMAVTAKNDTYTPAQVSAVTGLPLTAVHKAIEYRLIRPKRVREGNAVTRLLSKPQVLFLFLEAKGLRSLPLAARREVARALERNPRIDVMAMSEGSVVVIELKSARRAVETGLRRLAEAGRMVDSDSEVMHGAPIYLGTRIPVHAVADMLAQGATTEEILEGYPALTREKIELAPLYAKAFPRRGRPVARPWTTRRRRRVTRHRLAS